MFALCERLFPIRRSLTGDGVRETLAILAEQSRSRCARCPRAPRSSTGRFRASGTSGTPGSRARTASAWWTAADSNLHVVGYSVPVRRRMPLAELREHLHTLPDHPDWIPYRTSYWEERWGFCLEHARLEALPEGEYEVCIDATLEDGSLTTASCVLPGEARGEVLISTHICHPVACERQPVGHRRGHLRSRSALARAPRRLSYRFLFVPGTVGRDHLAGAQRGRGSTGSATGWC